MADAVDQEKFRMQNKRFALVAGPVFGLTVYLIMHFIDREKPSLSEGPNSFLFGDAHNWPSSMKHFWPADLFVCMASFWLLLRLLFVGLNARTGDPQTPWEWIKFGLGCFVGFGCFGALIGASLSGWYFGIEYFFIVGLFVTAMVAIIAVLIAVVGGVGLVFGYAGKAMKKRLQPTKVGSVAKVVKGYFNADDIVDTEDQPTNATRSL